MDRGTLPSLNTKIVLNVQLMVIQLQLTDGLVSMQRALLKDLFLYWVSKTRLSSVQRPTCLGVKVKTTQPSKFLVRLFICNLFFPKLEELFPQYQDSFKVREEAIVMASRIFRAHDQK